MQELRRIKNNADFNKIFRQIFAVSKIIPIFAPRLRNDANMVTVVQLVRASDCGSECRGFESHLPPNKNPCKLSTYEGFLFVGSGYLETEIMLNIA